LILTALIDARNHLRFEDLHLNPVLLHIHAFGHDLLDLKWYSIAYIAGIVAGWWYLLKLLAQPGAPMARRHADDLVFYATMGVILGGRIGYALFYAPQLLLSLDIFKLWDGGMSFHGGMIGTSLGLVWFARVHKLDWLRVHDYIACCVPFGLFFGRIANFVNGELWGKPADVPWAIIFTRGGGEVARHPSQLYEAGLEGIALFAVLWFFFWRTKARYDPGKLVGIFLLGYGLARFAIEFFREPDEQFANAFNGFFANVIHMGQVLCLPMIAGGIYLIATSAARRQRVESIAGSESVA
jgi:phosphatidylglycerol:prolipoprotein diacylglycerol transferase